MPWASQQKRSAAVGISKPSGGASVPQFLRLDCTEPGSAILEANTESREQGPCLQTDLAGAAGPDGRVETNTAARLRSRGVTCPVKPADD